MLSCNVQKLSEKVFHKIFLTLSKETTLSLYSKPNPWA